MFQKFVTGFEVFKIFEGDPRISGGLPKTCDTCDINEINDLRCDTGTPDLWLCCGAACVSPCGATPLSHGMALDRHFASAAPYG